MVWARWCPECLDRPQGCIRSNVSTEVVPSIVSRARQGGQVGLPLRVGNLGYPFGECLANRVEAYPITDAGLQHTGDLAGIVERSLGDCIGQNLVRVMAGQLDAAEQAGHGGGAVLDGDRDALVSCQVTVVDELVEPADGAPGGGELGGVGE